jgi:hypothetical protein
LALDLALIATKEEEEVTRSASFQALYGTALAGLGRTRYIQDATNIQSSKQCVNNCIYIYMYIDIYE